MITTPTKDYPFNNFPYFFNTVFCRWLLYSLFLTLNMYQLVNSDFFNMLYIISYFSSARFYFYYIRNSNFNV